MNKINKKKLIIKIGIVLIAFCLAFFIDQYYVEGKGSMFFIQLLKL